MPTTALVATAAPEAGNGRELQQLCSFYDDLLGRDYRQCTLSEYCDVLAETYKDNEYTCVGDLNGEFSITRQAYVCLDPQTDPSWIQADDKRVCYNETDRTDLFRYTSRRRTASYDFDVGFNFHYIAEAPLCSDDGAKQCSCTVSIEGRPCQSCAVCQNGLASVQANAYLYDLDCSNLAEGMTRSCDESFSWGEFFQIVEDLGVPPPPPAAAATSSPTTTSGISVNNKGLSSAALGGIIGAAVGVVLAGLFAIILIVALRAGKKKRGGTGRSDTGDPPGDRGGDRAGGAVNNNNNNNNNPMAVAESSNRNDHGGSALSYPVVVPMADAVLLDPAISGLGVTKPSFKNQVQAYRLNEEH
jgi:hypothetical protein